MLYKVFKRYTLLINLIKAAPINLKNKTLTIIAILALLPAITIAHTFEITATSGGGTLDLGTYVGSGNWTGYKSFCVYINSPPPMSANYDIKATTSNGSFSLTGASTLFYTLTWNDSDASGGSSMIYNQLLTSQTGSSMSGCSSSSNARLTVAISSSNMAAANAGIYSNTITLTLYTL
jgi:hypothetical protein